MQIITSNLIGSNVFSIHAGHNIGKIKDWFIDLKDLKISLFSVVTSTGQTNYLLNSDIRSLGVRGKAVVIIDHEDKLSEKDELVRYQELIENKTNLMGFKVKTVSGKNLGKVKDLSIDMQDLYILKIHLRAKAIARLLNERLLIDRTDIVEVKPGQITIRDNYAKTSKTVQKALPA